MVIRHAEKPDDDHGGVCPKGTADPHDLTVRGWKRAGALVRFFAPLRGKPPEPICTPQVIFASSHEIGSPSKRPEHTVRPLAKLLGEEMLNTDYGDGQEADVARAAEDAAASGPVLIAWHHEKIPGILQCLRVADCPEEWPDKRFDLVWVLKRTGRDARWALVKQVPQLLLAGDEGTNSVT
jgi:broad specificity phosphatase PhoE